MLVNSMEGVTQHVRIHFNVNAYSWAVRPFKVGYAVALLVISETTCHLVVSCSMVDNKLLLCT